jgi:hypothetical protein
MKFPKTSLGALALLAMSLAFGARPATAQPNLLDVLRAGSSAAFKIASPMQVGNASAFQNNNGVINQFPAASRIVEGHLSAIYFRVNRGTLLVEGTAQGTPLSADLALQPDGTLRIGIESQSGASTLSLQMAVVRDQILGSYFYTSGVIIHGSGGAITSSISSSYGGNFRSTLVPMPLQALPPLPPVGLEISDDAQSGRIVLRWQPGENPAGIRGYIVYRSIDIMGDRVRLGMVRELYFVDGSEEVRNLPMLTPVAYFVAAVGANGKESTPVMAQIVKPTYLPF